MAITITGSGHNSSITLYGIHQGNGSFRKDTATTHSQVKSMQRALTTVGYDTQGADGKFGDNTLAAVKDFQRENGLTVDGYFGKMSLNTLEEIYGDHIDEDCENSSSGGTTTGSSVHDKIVNDTSKTYKTMTATRIDSYSAAVSAINSFAGEGDPLTVAQYKANLDSIATVASNTYDKIDCSGFTYKAKNNQGYHGATTNFNKYCKYFGYINDLGGKDKLIPGMELYQAQRKSADDNQYYASHVGVYAGKYDFGDGNGPVHAVFQSSSNFGSLAVKYTKNKGTNGKRNGPNLSAMSSAWNYWAWSKYVKK